MTQWPGHAAEEVERLITVPIETEMNGLPDLGSSDRSRCTGCPTSRSRSRTAPTTISRASRCSSACPTSSCPRACRPAWRRCSRPLGSCIATCCRAPTAPPMELKILQDWVHRQAVQGRCPASPTCRSFGGETMQYQVLLDPTKLAGAGLSVPTSRRRSARTTATPAADSTRRAGSSTTCAASGASQTPEDIGNVVLAVQERHAGAREGRRRGRHRARAAPRPVRLQRPDDDAVEGVVLMRTGEQAQTVLKGVEEKTEELNNEHPAEGREGRAVLRSQRPDSADDAHGRGQPAPRHRARRSSS